MDDAEIHDMVQSVTSLVWMVRPAWVRELPLHDQLLWLVETMVNMYKGMENGQ